MINTIKNLGDIYYNFEFACPNNINEKPQYTLSGEIENIITKTEEEKKWIRILSKNILKNTKEYSWKIKILNSKNKDIMVGVAQKDPKIIFQKKKINNMMDMMVLPYMMIDDSPEFLIDFLNKGTLPFGSISNLGWYIRCSNSKLYSDSPQNFRDKKTKIKQIKDEIQIIMNMEKGILKFIVDNEDKCELYENIPLNEPLVPAVLLYDKDDSVKIIPC